jgi:hypothetical protein
MSAPTTEPTSPNCASRASQSVPARMTPRLPREHSVVDVRKCAICTRLKSGYFSGGSKITFTLSMPAPYRGAGDGAGRGGNGGAGTGGSSRDSE